MNNTTNISTEENIHNGVNNIIQANFGHYVIGGAVQCGDGFRTRSPHSQLALVPIAAWEIVGTKGNPYVPELRPIISADTSALNIDVSLHPNVGAPRDPGFDCDIIKYKEVYLYDANRDVVYGQLQCDRDNIFPSLQQFYDWFDERTYNQQADWAEVWDEFVEESKIA